MTYRNFDLRRFAQFAPHCMVPHCRKPNEGDVVAAHSNSAEHGKGMGLKASDAAVAYCCASCHAEIDQGPASRLAKHVMWMEAHSFTMIWLLETGRLAVPAHLMAPEPVKVVKRVRKSRPIAKGPPMKSKPFPKDGPKRPIPPRPFGK